MAGVPVTAGTWLPAGANLGDGLGTRPCRFFRARIHRPAGSTQPRSCPRISRSAALAGGDEEGPRSCRSSTGDWDGRGDAGSGEEMGEELSDGAGAATEMGRGDKQQQNGRSHPCLLVTGRLPSRHGPACRSRALEAAACPGHPQITSSPAPGAGGGTGKGSALPAGSRTPAGESGRPACRAGGARRKRLCKSQRVPGRGGPLPLSAPPAVCGAGPAWVWHEERLERRKTPRAAQPTPELHGKSWGCRGAPPPAPS